MSPELKLVIFEEKNILQELLELLDMQYEAIVEKEIIALEKINENLEIVSKKLAAMEIKRRGLVKEDKFSELIDRCDDNHIKEVHKEIKSLLDNLELQKNTNDTLLKQNLFFTNKMIGVIKPSKSAGTYNSYGKTR